MLLNLAVLIILSFARWPLKTLLGKAKVLITVQILTVLAQYFQHTAPVHIGLLLSAPFGTHPPDKALNDEVHPILSCLFAS